MTRKLGNRFFVFTIMIWSTSAIVGCSTLTFSPTSTAIATEIEISTKTPVPSATFTLTSKPSPAPYNGPNLLFFIQDDNRLFSIKADGSNQREIAHGVQFSISPDKKKLIYRTAKTMGSNNDELVVMDLAQENIIFRWSIPGYCDGLFVASQFTWSPDSQRIAFTLTGHDGAVGPVPNCEPEYNYEDMGIYQIDLISRKINHPPLTDEFLFDLLHAKVSYSSDGSKLRIGTRGQAFDAETWEKTDTEPFYDLIQLCNQPEKIGICDDSNLCLHSQNDQIAKYLTEYRAHREFSVQSFESVETFKLFSNCSSVVYETKRIWMPPLTPEPNNELVFFTRTLHLLSLKDASDQVIGSNIWGYYITPDNSKVVFYEQEITIDESGIFVASSDGSNRHLIAKFERRHAPKLGPLIAVSPTGEKVAFINSEGIAIIDLDGNNLIQIVTLPNGAPGDEISLEILDWQ